MSFNIVTKTITNPDGRTITIETGKLARQADGAVTVRMGNTVLMATVVAAADAKPGVDFMPLTVDYQEKFASAGRIPGGFLRRESRLSDYEVLISRLVDRAMRPTFPEDFHADVQVFIQMISADADVLPDQLAGLAAAAAMAVSDIPFNGPISEVRVVKANGEFVVNPLTAVLREAEMDIIVAANAKDILMVEGEMSECSEQDILTGLSLAHDAIKQHCVVLNELTVAVGKTEKRAYSHETHDEDLRKLITDNYYGKVYAVCQQQNPSKKARKEGFKAVYEEFVNSLPEDHTYDMGLAKTYFHDIEWLAARNLVLDERTRLDGRKLDQIRPIWCEVDYLPSPHGSSLFTRGETQSLSTVTLGTKLDEQIIDQPLTQGYNKFMLHYNFPGFSTGEVKPNRAPARREVGHGNLAMRAIKQVLPSHDEFPYTIRIVSDILESNGSSSMATVCAGTLALMDAGVKIKAPVSGIAMGLITNEEGKFAVLSDILGDEDHLGDMDFKVTGTENGITAVQMDIKVDGLPYEVLTQALEQAKQGRLHILREMKKAIEATRPTLKPHAPQVVLIKIPKDQIGAVIGPGGKIIQGIQAESGATLNIEEVADGGNVSIFATNAASMDKAVAMVKNIVAIPEPGETYTGKVKGIQTFGAFVEFMPGKEGLLHISEISWERLETMDGVLEEGEEVTVKLLEVDKKTGKYRLSRKVLLPKPEGYVERPPRTDRPDRPRDDRGDRGRDDRNRGGGKPWNKR
jgi:polyribonucleotide nucleotidyltransferase